MNLAEASKYLDNLPSFTAKGVRDGKISYNLLAIRELLKRLGNPSHGMKIVHIAGTNGKGSTAIYLSNILEAGGYRIGVFSSPELISFDEQIKINGEIIPNGDTARIISQIKEISLEMAKENMPCPSKFEIIFATALQYFKEEKCDAVILECGLGGTNDATNAIGTPMLSLITDIDFDHTALLGNTLREIAGHKAGIIKSKGKALAIAGSNEVEEVLRKRAKEVDAELEFVNISSYCSSIKREKNMSGQSFEVKDIDGRIYTKMLGGYQIRNAGLAIRASKELRKNGFEFSDDDIKCGISKAINPCRFELISKNPYIIIDGAHNLGGVKELTKSLGSIFSGEKLIFISGILRDKEYMKMLKTILPYVQFLYAVKPESERALEAEKLAEKALEIGIKAVACESYEEAIDSAISKANGKPICIFGSLYFAGRIRELIISGKA